MIAALKATKGSVYLAAERLGCSHQTVYNYIDRYATVKDAYEFESGRTLDVAELALYKAIQDGESWAVKFILSTKGKNRGYTERTELTGAEGGPVPIQYVREVRQDDGD